MKRITVSPISLIAVAAAWPAVAADLRRPVPYLPPVAPVYSWTGFYLGGNVGGAWASTTLTDVLTGASWTGNGSAFIGGVQLGYNFQFGGLVAGVEWDFDWIGQNGTNASVATALGTLQGSTRANWVTTVAGRFGTAMDRWLVYGKAGAGWVEHDTTIANLTTGASWSGSGTRSGWLLGAGVEYAFAPNWTAKLEYNYLGLGNWSAATTLAPGNTANVSGALQMVKAGVNFKF